MPGSERGAGCATGGGGSGAEGGAAADFGSAGAPAVGGTSRRAAGGGAVACSRLGARFWPDKMSIAGTRPSGSSRAKPLANRGSPLVKYQMRA